MVVARRKDDDKCTGSPHTQFHLAALQERLDIHALAKCWAKVRWYLGLIEYLTTEATGLATKD